MIKTDSDFWRRFRFYGFGLLMGCCLVSVITKGKACRMPATLKLEELNAKTIVFSKEALKSMDCREFNTEDIKSLLKKGSVNIGKSEVHARPIPIFAVDGYTKNKHHLRLIIENGRDTSRIMNMTDLDSEKDPCYYK